MTCPCRLARLPLARLPKQLIGGPITTHLKKWKMRRLVLYMICPECFDRPTLTDEVEDAIRRDGVNETLSWCA
jgi:hypothetical protein